MSDQPTDPGSTDHPSAGGPPGGPPGGQQPPSQPPNQPPAQPPNPWAPPPQSPYVPPPGQYTVPPGGSYAPPAHDPYAQPTGAQGGYSSAPPSAADASGFFRALFDFSFNRFITPMIIKFVYVLMMIVIAIVYLFYAIALFSTDASSLGVLWLLVIGPIASILWLAIARMTLEFYLAVVRVSEDVHRAVDRGGR